MRRVTSIRTVGALLGALLALNVVSLGAQQDLANPSEPSENLQTRTEHSASLSFEQRADIFMARKEFGHAIEYYSDSIKSQQKSPQDRLVIARLWNKIGICYQQEMEYGKARKAYKKAIRLNRDFAQPWNNIGTTFYLSKQPKKSIKYYRHAIELEPGGASYHFNLGTAYFDRRKYRKATEEYRAAIEIDPDILTKNSREGTAVETRHADAKFFFYMAKIYAGTGDSSKAVRYLQRAMEEGFNDQKRILQDPDLQKISKDPAFIALMKNPPVAIKD
jgi:tetratricopeptide (TPR) repeat protein